jgi:hypothetical protein
VPLGAYFQECNLGLNASKFQSRRYKKITFWDENNNTTELSSNRIRRVVHSHTITLLIVLTDYWSGGVLSKQLSRRLSTRNAFSGHSSRAFIGCDPEKGPIDFVLSCFQRYKNYSFELDSRHSIFEDAAWAEIARSDVQHN